MKRRTQISTEVTARSADPSASLIELWCLRMLACGKGRKIPRQLDLTPKGIAMVDDAELLHALGLDEVLDEKANLHTIRHALQRRLRTAEDSKPALAGTVLDNVRSLGERLALCNEEQVILGFSVHLHSGGILDDCADTLGDLTRGRLTQTLAAVLKVSEEGIRAALHPRGLLASSGLLKVDIKSAHTLRNKLDLLDGLVDALTSHRSDAGEIFDFYFRRSPEPKLSADDFRHLRRDYATLRAYLRASAESGRPGSNILFYGQPGTGKTELVRTLCSEADVGLYEISTLNGDAEPIEGKDRFSALQLAQSVLGRTHRHAILFDEIEDVFPDTWDRVFGHRSKGERNKGWVNRLLETNPVPTFWLSNEVHQIDPAFLRRFDYVLELRPPTPGMRRRMLERYLNHLSLSDRWLDKMAQHDGLMPAQIESAARVVNTLRTQNQEATQRTLELVMGNTLEVLGQPRKPSTYFSPVTNYDLRYLNPGQDLAAVTAGLKRRRRGRLCLYGPPGTGKTAFAHHLARQLDMSLTIKRASDLLGCWVGETEKNIAKMFQRAEAEDALLLLDEADNFLQDRAHAQRIWEITQVNELLTQMEMFDGVFICATNLFETLDAASLRRFDLKIHFGYLTKDKAELFFSNLLRELQGSQRFSMSTVLQKRLATLENLTPGDFAAASRKLRLRSTDIDEITFLEFLKEECNLKLGARRFSPGFTATA